VYGFDGFDNALLKVELGVAPDLLEGLLGDVVPVFLAQAVDINIDRHVIRGSGTKKYDIFNYDEEIFQMLFFISP